jgi:hypothetical protein
VRVPWTRRIREKFLIRDNNTERLNIMKMNYKLSINMIASLAIILPMSAFADDQNQGGKKQGNSSRDGQQQGGRGASQGASHASNQALGNSQNQGRMNNSSSAQRNSTRISNSSGTVNQNNSRSSTSQSVQQSGIQQNQVSSNRQLNQAATPSGRQLTQSQVRTNQQQNPASLSTGRQLTQSQVRSNQQRSSTQYSSNQRQYTQSNNYGGLWYPANSHSGWNQNNQYYWNNHNYGWYNGGWLIIDAGFNPYYANNGYYGNGYSNYGYSSGGSTVANVQSSLATQGYYRGAIDGINGPGTRNAIANYQGDNGLRATGRIDDPLLQSLGI